MIKHMHSGNENIKLEDEDQTARESPRKKARTVKLEHSEMEIPFWKSRIKADALNPDNWQNLILGYQREFNNMDSDQTTTDYRDGLNTLVFLQC
jgi:hypothetical protein